MRAGFCDAWLVASLHKLRIGFANLRDLDVRDAPYTYAGFRMIQAIAGVAPPAFGEVTNMIVWPTIAARPEGRWVGQMCGIQAGLGTFFTVGKLMALAMIPVAVGLFAMSLAPWAAWRYKLTNRRLIKLRGPLGKEDSSIPLDGFDAIEVKVLPGQEWFPAGELIFRKGPVEVFQLSGVSRPETFRQACLKSRNAFVGVRDALAHAS